MENIDKFPLKGTVTNDDILRIQHRLLKMAVIVRDILEKHGIPYTILFGSLLGAIRHKNFIPWDVDFDIGVTEEYYCDATKIVSECLPEWLVEQNQNTDPCYCAFWSKIVDKNSILKSSAYSSDNHFKYKGIHLDIYKLKRTNSSNYEFDLLNDNREYFMRKYNNGLMSKAEYEKKINDINLKQDIVIGGSNLYKDNYYFLQYMNTKEENIFPLKRYEFANEYFWGPNDSDKVLKDCYYDGDYMQLPPYEKRDIKIDSIVFL